MQNDCFLKALRRESVDRTPVWLMRQAGRYLPEYRKLRAKAPDFMTFCKTPDLACEVTLQPIRRFGFDAAILFSDILTIPDALNVGLEFVTGEGPKIHRTIRSMSDVTSLPDLIVLEKLDYVFKAVKLVQQELAGKIPLIGFAGSPWTVACYMVEGSGSKTFFMIRQMLYANPEILHALLQKLAEITIEYLNGQIEAGVNVVMLFDTWGGLLTPKLYQAFSLHYMQIILDSLKRERNGEKIPVIFFTKGAGNWLELMASSGCDALGVDWTINIGEARKRVADKVAVQGNLDPAVLLSTPRVVKQTVQQILADWGDCPGHIFNLGHGIDKNTPIENVEALIEAVRC